MVGGANIRRYSGHTLPALRCRALARRRVPRSRPGRGPGALVVALGDSLVAALVTLDDWLS